MKRNQNQRPQNKQNKIENKKALVKNSEPFFVYIIFYELIDYD